jgi:catechol 2,3-dioxygenase
MTATTVLHPKFHHFNLKTTRLQEMIDFYRTLVGAEVIHQDQVGAWMSNDEANHRIAFLAFPNFIDDPEKDARTGMHHSAFEYPTFDDLMSTYVRLRDEGITPAICLDHGMTFSYYYADPDGNNVELQVDNFGGWRKSTDSMLLDLDASLRRHGDELEVTATTHADHHQLGMTHSTLGMIHTPSELIIHAWLIRDPA